MTTSSDKPLNPDDQQYGILTNPAYLAGQANAPLPKVSPQAAPPDQIPTIKPQQATQPGAIPTIGSQPNVARQRQEQSLRNAAYKYENPTKPQGFWGKSGHILSTIGNIAGDIFAPSTMALIPGTQLHNAAQHNAGIRELNELGKEDTQDAVTDKTRQETALEPGKVQSEEELEGAQKTKLDQEAANGPDLATAYAQAVKQAIKNNTDPSEDPIVQHIGDAITAIQKQNPTGTKTIQREVGGQPHTILVDDRSGADIRDEGQTGEKPPVVKVETPSDTRALKNDLLKAYQPTLDSAERMNVMSDAYEKAIKDHDQQAMLNLLANHLGMTMGLQKGARMTKDIINEAQQSTPWLQGIKAKFDSDGYLSGVTLSPGQMRQMVNLGQERYAEDVKKSRATAQYLGAKDDGPDRVPGPATIRYYTALAGGDPAKAKQLATSDGWTVK